jgi:hypothetical protein
VRLEESPEAEGRLDVISLYAGRMGLDLLLALSASGMEVGGR